MRVSIRILAGAMAAVALLGTAATAQVDPAASWASMPSSAILRVMPNGTGQTLAGAGTWIDVYLQDIVTGTPITTMSRALFEVDAMPPANLADGFNASVLPIHDLGPGAFTNLGGGFYRIECTLLAGGFATGAMVKVQGVILSGRPLPLPLQLNSPDLNGNGVVNLSDAGIFTTVLFGSYDWRADFNHDGTVNLSDVGFMAASLGASFPPGFIVDPVD